MIRDQLGMDGLTRDELESLCRRLTDENNRLRALLSHHQIRFDESPEDSLPDEMTESVPATELEASPAPAVTKESPLPEKIELFLSLFRGREDVYAYRWEGNKGKAGYSPACANDWVEGVCPKPDKTKCGTCRHAQFYPFDYTAVERHLSGRIVLGVYPLRKDDACCFLAIDLDDEGWEADADALRSVYDMYQFPYSVERSRSGKGAHV